MKIRFFLSLMLVPVLVAACAPAASTAAPGMAVSSPTQVTESAAVALSPTPLPVATSRGPHLHATDPTTVSLASGDLQLVEFFRFT